MHKKYQLKNGLKVVLIESHKAPVLSIQMWVRTGSADEKNSEAGISHFIEHLVFKGTDKYKAGEIASTVEASGGELNAYTSFDQTVFYVTISSQFVDTGLSVISQMMGFPAFDKNEVDLEREVVVEEIKRGNDSLGRKASELMFSTVFKKHNYGRPVIGYEKNVRRWPVREIRKFFQDRYSPKNMFLVVSGDFSEPGMKEKIKNYFGQMRPTKVRSVKRVKEVKQSKPRLIVQKSSFEQNICGLAWRIPGATHKDAPALDILSIILGQGDSSRLVKRLRIESILVNSVGASAYTPLDEGVFGINISYNFENFEKALSVILEELVEILTVPAKIDEIKRAVLGIEIEDLYSMETVDSMTRKYGSLEFYYKDLNQQQRYIKAVKSVTAADLQKMVKKYLLPTATNVTVTTKENEAETKEILLKWIKDFEAKFKKAKPQKFPTKKIQHIKALNKKATVKNPKTIKATLSNGLTLLMRPSSDTALVSLKSAFLGGSRMEDKNHLGLVDLLGRTWTGGTKARSEIEIYSQSEAIATSISPVTGRHSVGLGIDFLDGFKENALDLYFDVLSDPQFPDEIIEREKQIQLEQIKSKKDNPAQVCISQFMRDMFKGHPYAEESLGTAQTVKEINRKSITDYWNQIAQLKNLTISVAGNFDPQSMQKEIENRVQKFQAGKRIFLNQKPLDLKKDIVSFELTKKEQSHIVYGFRGLSMEDEDRFTLQIIQSILAGQGGRLFLELRDKNSLAYSVSPLRMEGLGTGYFGAYIGCSPEKGKTAIRMMKEQFDRLMNETVPGAELDRAKKYLLGKHDIELQRTSAISSAILYNDIYGLDYDEAFNSREKYMAVTASGLQDLAKKIFSQPSIISVVGAVNPLAEAV